MNQPPYTPLDHWEAWANKHKCVPLQTDWEAVAADQAMTIALLKSEQQAEPVAWLAKTQTQYPAGTHPLIFTDKAAADRWLSDFTQGFAWLEPLYLRPPQVNI